MTMQQSSVTDPGASLVTALGERDFDRLADALSADVSMRALIPPGPVEVTGRDAAAARFASWFGDREGLTIMASTSEAVGDRVHVSYRLRLKDAGGHWRIVEQHLFCTVEGGRISALDLVCSGFRPEETAA
jgi:ketosteroid isomerase-like protein